MITRSPFPFEKASRDSSSGIRHFLIIDGKGNEIESLSFLIRSHCSNEDDRLPILNQYRTIRLPCHLPRFNGKWPSSKIDLQLLNHTVLFSPLMFNSYFSKTEEWNLFPKTQLIQDHPVSIHFFL